MTLSALLVLLLAVATPGHPLESAMGLVPVTETMLSPANLAIAAITLGIESPSLPDVAGRRR